MPKKLSKDFYTRMDPVQISKDLLGKYLVTKIDGAITAGMIVETEAYHGPEDKAAHSFGGRRTDRTEVMFWEGGFAYVYLCYGIHHLFNVVTAVDGVPHAVLIRGVEPAEGVNIMLERREMHQLKPNLTAGPGALSKALGIKTSHTKTPLNSDIIWIEDRGILLEEKEIIASPRVGVAYAKEDALLPWRFRIKGNPYTSPAK